MLGEAPSYFAPRLTRTGRWSPIALFAPSEARAGLQLETACRRCRAHDAAGLPQPLIGRPTPRRSCTPARTRKDRRRSACHRATRDHRANTRTVVADPNHSLYQGRFSPDGKWITFNAQSLKNVGTSLLGVVPPQAASGPRSPTPVCGWTSRDGGPTGGRFTSSRTARAASSTSGASRSTPSPDGQPARNSA